MITTRTRTRTRKKIPMKHTRKKRTSKRTKRTTPIHRGGLPIPTWMRRKQKDINSNNPNPNLNTRDGIFRTSRSVFGTDGMAKIKSLINSTPGGVHLLNLLFKILSKKTITIETNNNILTGKDDTSTDMPSITLTDPNKVFLKQLADEFDPNNPSNKNLVSKHTLFLEKVNTLLKSQQKLEPVLNDIMDTIRDTLNKPNTVANNNEVPVMLSNDEFQENENVQNIGAPDNQQTNDATGPINS